MRKVVRGFVVATVIGWITRFLTSIWNKWSARPASEIRATVERVLPDAIDETRKHEIADRVVAAMKGRSAVGEPREVPVAQQAMTPPIPETPSGTHEQN